MYKAFDFHFTSHIDMSSLIILQSGLMNKNDKIINNYQHK